MLFGVLGFLHLMAFAAPPTAPAEPNGPELISRGDEIERWVPSVSAALGLLLQRTSGSLATGDILDPAWVQDPLFLTSPAIAQPASGRDLALTPVATFAFELMTPGLLSVPQFAQIRVPGRPRLFAHADVVPSFGPTYRTAKNGTPGPHHLAFESGEINPEPLVEGQGAILKSQVQRWQFAAGAGVALSVDLWERRFRIKPSFEYMTEEIEIDGVVRRAAAVTLNPTSIDDFRFIFLSATKKKRYHGLGVGIELEMDTRRAGPVLLSVFASGRGYRFLGDLDMRVIDTNSFGETATLRFAKKRYAYRGSLGMRVRFAPE